MTAGRPAGGGPADKGALARNLQAAIGHHRAGRFDDAERLYNDILAQHPEQPDALNFLGVLAGQRGAPAAAIDYLTRAIAVDRRDPAYHYNLGLAYQAAKMPNEADKSFKRALELDPAHIDALKGMGGALLALGRLDEAERCCRQVAERAPGDPRAHNNLATVLLGLERIDEAEASARQALRLMPNFADAHNNLGNIHLTREEHGDAEACFRSALHLMPRNSDALNNLGIALLGLGRFDEAIASFRAAIESKPDYAEAHNSLANTYREIGFTADAEREYREALRYRPDYPNALLHLGTALVDGGNVDAALRHYDDVLLRNPELAGVVAAKAWLLNLKGDVDACYEIVAPIVDAGEGNPAIATIFGRIARHFDREDDAVQLIEEMSTRDDLKREQRQTLHFALGMLYDSAHDFDRAFDQFAKGNALQPTSYHPDKAVAANDRMIAIFSAENVPTMARATNRSDLPVFIVGMPRSGTTLTEQILSSHPAVFGAGELEHIARIARNLSPRPDMLRTIPDRLGQLDVPEIDEIAESHLGTLREMGGEALRVTDKFPYNFLVLGLIAQLFPKARVVHCMRDPMDTSLSCFIQNFSRRNVQTYNLDHLGRYYVQYQRLMDHWREVLDLPIMDIVYEELVADLEGKSRELIDFVGLEWDPQCLRFHESGRVVNTASYDQVRQPIYSRSVGRWRHYESHLGPLKEALAGAS